MITTVLDTKDVGFLPPGGHVVLLTDDPCAALKGRDLGLELRDAFYIVGPEGVRFAYLFRRELDGTVAENIVRYETGGLNIAACRVGQEGGTRKVNPEKRPSKYAFGDGLNGGGSVPIDAGRWPPNMLLIHGAGCRVVGERLVRASTGQADATPTDTQIATPIHSGRHYGDENGMEPLPEWECDEMCPVTALDSVSGDAGGASRFFPQFANEEGLRDWFLTLLGKSV
jgi:hypothetical protein